jgi:hypothetical protein
MAWRRGRRTGTQRSPVRRWRRRRGQPRTAAGAPRRRGPAAAAARPSPCLLRVHPDESVSDFRVTHVELIGDQPLPTLEIFGGLPDATLWIGTERAAMKDETEGANARAPVSRRVAWTL